MQWLNLLDRQKRVECFAAQEAGVRERFGLSHADTDASAWAIREDGARYSAASAVIVALAAALDAPWLRHLFAMRFVLKASEWLYHWVAGHRYLFPGAEPYCVQHACPDA